MIKSTFTTIKFANINKREFLYNIIDEYRKTTEFFIDILWNKYKIPALLPNTITSKVDTWLSARLIQCAGKQASAIVRGTRKKQDQRRWVVSKLISEGKHKQARKLQKLINSVNISKPNINSICPELDARFVKIDLDNPTTFDGWITLASIGDKIKLEIPFKKTKHFNKMLKKGTLKSGIRISKKQITFMFDVPDKPKRTSGSTIGIDIGQNAAISCSNGFQSKECKHGHTLGSISDKLSRKKKGSKSFQRAVQHRKNYINWSINQLNLDNVKECRIENIRNIRKYKRTNRRLSHWTYTDIFDKLESKCEEQGVLVNRVNPTYTSQRCSVCGWTRRGNRKGSLFKCGQCDFTADADLNASNNIASTLKPISYKERHLFPIKTGFWWKLDGKAPVVPSV